MNKKIKSTNVEDLIFFDIETARKNKKLDPKSKEFELFQWSLRDRDTLKLPTKKDTADTYNLKAALKPQFNRIVCITVGFVKKGVIYLKTLKGDQKDIIRDFYDILNSQPKMVPAGYNIIGFDMPVVRLKAFEEGVEINIRESLIDSQKKPWNLTDSFLDVMDVLKGSYFYPMSMDDACYMAGVSSPKEGDIKGAEVSNAFYDGKIDEICEYCERDVEACIKLFLKVQGNGYEIKETVIRGTEEKVKDFSDEPVIKRIFDKGQIDPEDFDELMSKTKKMKKKERAQTCEILTSALLHKDKKTLDTDEQDVLDQIMAQK